jgi:hypothetical protein
VLLLNEYLLLLLFISLSTQSENFWIHPRKMYMYMKLTQKKRLGSPCFILHVHVARNVYGASVHFQLEQICVPYISKCYVRPYVIQVTRGPRAVTCHTRTDSLGIGPTAL